jgi:hypothetical protein
MLGMLKFVFIVSIATLVISLVSLSFLSVLRGLQKVDTKNILEIVIGWLSALGTILVLVRGGGLRELAVFSFIIALLKSLVIAGMVKSIFPWITWNPFLFDFGILKKILKFSLKMFITTTLAGLANYYTDPLVLGYFLNHFCPLKIKGITPLVI